MLSSNDWNARLSKQWDTYLGEICTNIRQLHLLINDLTIAEPMVRGEVNPNDLVAIVAIQRFNPRLHAAIYKYSGFLTYSPVIFRAREFLTDREEQARDTHARKEILEAIEASAVPGAYEKMLGEMFPEVRTKLREDPLKARISYDSNEERNQSKFEKRISHPDYFPIYFRYQVPDTIVSVRYFEEIKSQVEWSKDSSDLSAKLAKVFSAVEQGTLKR